MTNSSNILLVIDDEKQEIKEMNSVYQEWNKKVKQIYQTIKAELLQYKASISFNLQKYCISIKLDRNIALPLEIA